MALAPPPEFQTLRNANTHSARILTRLKAEQAIICLHDKPMTLYDRMSLDAQALRIYMEQLTWYGERREVFLKADEARAIVLMDPTILAWIDTESSAPRGRCERELSYREIATQMRPGSHEWLPRVVLLRLAPMLGVRPDPLVATALTASEYVWMLSRQHGFHPWHGPPDDRLAANLERELAVRGVIATRGIYERSGVAAKLEKCLARPGVCNKREAADLQTLIGSFVSSVITGLHPVVARSKRKRTQEEEEEEETQKKARAHE